MKEKLKEISKKVYEKGFSDGYEVGFRDGYKKGLGIIGENETYCRLFLSEGDAYGK